ncbi:unnamed protein product [Diatraea saccharalis]|uniref:Uncharacterized protein n=1 Tax=Diatraea saccharalis TaxID=40085 RepID=A0A9N9R4Z2_9NEOP|nr:unnamed protein product [Diatraea saccharalis]
MFTLAIGCIHSGLNEHSGASSYSSKCDPVQCNLQPFTKMNPGKANADDLFPSEGEITDDNSKKVIKRKSSASASTPRADSSKKPNFKPIPEKKNTCTARELFGTDSEDDDNTELLSGKNAPIVSYISRRLANGQSRQAYDRKPGNYFIDLKVYQCEDIERIQPVNRWRQAIITVKNRINDDSEAWCHLSNFLTSTRKEYRQCPPTFISNYY